MFINVLIKRSKLRGGNVSYQVLRTNVLLQTKRVYQNVAA